MKGGSCAKIDFVPGMKLAEGQEMDIMVATTSVSQLNLPGRPLAQVNSVFYAIPFANLTSTSRRR